VPRSLDPARGALLWLGLEDCQGSGLRQHATHARPVDLDGLEVIGMDEFAIQKGHRYATVIVEPTRRPRAGGSPKRQASG
jgi:hypothetical protein